MDLSKAQIGVLIENQFQELELWYPVMRLREAGAKVFIIGPARNQLYASKLGMPTRCDLAMDEVSADDLDAIVVPGGLAPEGMRKHKPMVDLVRAMHDQGKLVATICHAGWLLASADIARGRRVTCVFLVKDDVINAGGHYVDEAVVVDGNIITSRLPSDLPLWTKEIIAYLQAAPSLRKGRELAYADGAPARAAYTHTAEVVTMARAKASANYIAVTREGAVVPA